MFEINVNAIKEETIRRFEEEVELLKSGSSKKTEFARHERNHDKNTDGEEHIGLRWQAIAKAEGIVSIKNIGDRESRRSE